jgi:radial spoke head protein 9
LDDTEEEDPNKDFVARNLIEVDRLFYTVLAIENDCSIVPHGSFRLTEKHEVARNVAFRGLSSEQTFKLECYMHFRNVQDAKKAKLLLEDDAVFQPNFLDDITTDLPKGCWSL